MCQGVDDGGDVHWPFGWRLEFAAVDETAVGEVGTSFHDAGVAGISPASLHRLVLGPPVGLRHVGWWFLRHSSSKSKCRHRQCPRNGLRFRPHIRGMGWGAPDTSRTHESDMWQHVRRLNPLTHQKSGSPAGRPTGHLPEPATAAVSAAAADSRHRCVAALVSA